MTCVRSSRYVLPRRWFWKETSQRFNEHAVIHGQHLPEYLPDASFEPFADGSLQICRPFETPGRIQPMRISFLTEIRQKSMFNQSKHQADDLRFMSTCINFLRRLFIKDAMKGLAPGITTRSKIATSNKGIATNGAKSY